MHQAQHLPQIPHEEEIPHEEFEHQTQLVAQHSHVFFKSRYMFRFIVIQPIEVFRNKLFFKTALQSHKIWIIQLELKVIVKVVVQFEVKVVVDWGRCYPDGYNHPDHSITQNNKIREIFFFSSKESYLCYFLWNL